MTERDACEEAYKRGYEDGRRVSRDTPVAAREGMVLEGVRAEQASRNGWPNFPIWRCPICGKCVYDRIFDLIHAYCDKCGQHIADPRKTVGADIEKENVK